MERIAVSVRSSGNLGITTTQLVRSTGADPERVRTSLRLLEAQRRVTRVGHGLWVDRRLIADPSGGRGFSAPEGYLTKFTRGAKIPVGAFSGDIQFRPNAEEAVHRWWPYVQGFSAGFVREILRRHAIGRGHTVLDPFAGSGTVPVAARMEGAGAIGVELMPISAFVAAAKQRWEVDPGALSDASSELLENARTAHLAALP
ncbi:MAG: site-specific DNA-methyltransferase, partial [Thermoplasmata archaeon]|nr:site-specific DNA-methyltransferase [Thermoplasmata archaeon]